MEPSPDGGTFILGHDYKCSQVKGDARKDFEQKMSVALNKEDTIFFHFLRVLYW